MYQFLFIIWNAKSAKRYKARQVYQPDKIFGPFMLLCELYALTTYEYKRFSENCNRLQVISIKSTSWHTSRDKEPTANVIPGSIRLSIVARDIISQ